MKNSLRETYNSLFTYFGLSSLDRFTKSASGQEGKKSDKTSATATAESNAYYALFADHTYNPSIDEICEYIQEIGLDNSKKMFCITPFDDTMKKVDMKKIPINDSSVTGYKDQGIYGTTFKKDTTKTKGFSVKDMHPEKFGDASSVGLGRVDVVQVFPISKSPELADTDVLSLYMSTINSVNMSRAVPYVEVLVGMEGSASDSSSRPFSLGKFLSFSPPGSSDPILDARFLDDPLVSQREIKGKSNIINLNTRAVASMEVFTTPQTLVNASPENIRYDENSQVGRHFDVFRPFLNLESIAIHVLPAGAGTISLKTAEMKIRLFDRGRLAEIAPIISPSKFGVVKFDIEYGWSHPSGSKVHRRSDADADRIGDLIDEMRVRETFQLVNSNMTFEQDGTVSIDLKLTMHSTSALQESTIKFAGEHDTAEIAKILEDMGHLISIKPANVNVPAVLTGNADTFLSMTKESKQELEKFIAHAKNGGSGSLVGLANAAAKLLYGSKGNKSPVEKFQENRRTALKSFIENLRKNPDPFLRREGLSGGELGVTNAEIESGNYASLGTILVTTMGEILRKDGDVIFIFGAFNKDAGAMYDHNIAQFPVKISSGEKSTAVDLYTVLEKKLTTLSKISPQAFFQIVNDEFILRESSEAYGLTQLYELPQYRVNKDGKEDEKKDKVKIKFAKNDEDENSAGNQLLIEEKKIANLKAIYGADKRVRPNFSLPRLNIKIDSKPSEGGRNVIRVIITDQVANSVGDAMQIFNDTMSRGFFVDDSDGYEGPDATNVRGAGHKDIYKNVLAELSKLQLTKSYKGGTGNLKNDLLNQENGPMKDIKIDEKKMGDFESVLKKILFIDTRGDPSSNMKLRDVFFRNYPTLIYGSEGSGIIAAQLSTQQNAALTTIAIQKQGKQEDTNPNLPMMIHPTQLSLEVFGSPLFKYTQKFFIDFGTGTSADNFYVVSGVDMELSPTDFKCNLKMTQLDSYGGMMKLTDRILETVVSTLQLENFKKQTPSSSVGKGGKGGKDRKGGKGGISAEERKAAEKLNAEAKTRSNAAAAGSGG